MGYFRKSSVYIILIIVSVLLVSGCVFSDSPENTVRKFFDYTMFGEQADFESAKNLTTGEDKNLEIGLSGNRKTPPLLNFNIKNITTIYNENNTLAVVWGIMGNESVDIYFSFDLIKISETWKIRYYRKEPTLGDFPGSTDCKVDDDCGLSRPQCCVCSGADKSRAINKDFITFWEDIMKTYCHGYSCLCMTESRFSAKCINSTCTTIRHDPKFDMHNSNLSAGILRLIDAETIDMDKRVHIYVDGDLLKCNWTYISTFPDSVIQCISDQLKGCEKLRLIAYSYEDIESCDLFS